MGIHRTRTDAFGAAGCSTGRSVFDIAVSHRSRTSPFWSCRWPRWFLSYLADIPGAVLFQTPLTYIVFTAKMMLAFGLVFQLPVVLMFLGKVGIITSALMIKFWRQITVGLFTMAMVVAPSNDPGTMLALAIPLTLLFLGSIWLVRLVEPRPSAS